MKDRQPRIWIWPALVIGFLSAQAIACAVTIYLAISDPSHAVEPDYDTKALDWDAQVIEQRASAALGWSVRFDLNGTTRPDGRQPLVLHITDKAGRPVNDLRVEVTLFNHARGAQRQTIRFVPQAAGFYEASARMPRGGLWELRTRAAGGPTVFVDTQTLQYRPKTGTTL